MTLFNCAVRQVATAAWWIATYPDRVTHAQPSPAVRVGVTLAADPSDVGEWLRDAAAFDAAGAHALWVEATSQSELDPLAIAAALAVVTFRAHLFVRLADPDVASPAFRRQLATVDRLSRGRLRVVFDGDGLPSDGVPVVRRVSENPELVEDINGYRWSVESTPDSRAGWRAMRDAAAENGVYGLIVPASPRLLDLLRNPDDEGDRRDLQLTVG